MSIPLKRKWLTVLIHVLVWSILFMLPLLLRPEHHEFRQTRIERGNGLIPFYIPIVNNLLIVPLFYVNLYILFPKFVLAKKYFLYIASQVLAILIIALWSKYILELLNSGAAFGPFRPRFINVVQIFICLFVALAAFSYGLLNENIRKERLENRKEKETLKSELQYLRWQISPHFLFNVLNSLVALSRFKSDRLEHMLIELSTLLRYMIYDSSEAKIPIQKESEYLLSYIQLQNTRVGPDVKITTSIEVPETCSMLIEPMLLIPFVENAYKHGIGLVDKPYIYIKLSVSGSMLFFTVGNKKTPREKSGTKDNASGIGVQNVKRRLELLYPGKYTMNVNEKEESYYVNLQIGLA